MPKTEPVVVTELKGCPEFALPVAVGFSESQREEIARILEIVAKDGLSQPRDLDVALDAIEAAFKDGP